jgi:hypothetical protein
MKRLRFAFALLAFTPVAQADDFPPLTNLATLARFTPLPALGESVVVHEDSTRARFTAAVTNEYASEGYTPSGACPASARECLLLDGETQRYSFQYAGPLAAAAEWRVEVPVLVEGGGFMDSFIETWHGWFGLPNGNREFAPRGRYHYQYVRKGATVLDVTDPHTGFGDVELGVAFQLVERVALRAELKLPTGDSDHLTGGNGGAAAWFDAPLPAPDGCGGYSGIGIAFANRSDVLPGQQRRVVPFGGLGFHCTLFSPVSLYTQIYGHGPLYEDSRLRELARWGAPLGAGLRVRWSASTVVSLGILEDPSVNVSPDFGLQLAVTWR